MLDTNVYILQLAGRLPPAVSALVEAATLHHCTVCLAEIAVGLACRDVCAPGWRREMGAWARVFGSMAPRRVHAPDTEAATAAGLLAGTLARVGGYGAPRRKDALNDALVFATALKAGLPVLTENRADFDRLQQLVPEARVYYIL